MPTRARSFRIRRGAPVPVLAALAVGAVTVGPRAAHADDTVNVLVLREHGVGSAAHAQKYLDRLVAAAAKQNGWTSAAGKYHTRRASAESYIGSAKPHFGIMSLGAFLALRGKHKLKVIGKAEVAGAGGRQYHLISKTHGSLADCKGKSLASDHADDPKFVEKVVARGKFKLSDFTLVQTRRPLQTVKKVIRGEAECALVDDAQLKDLGNVDGGSALKSVWSSARLPPMVVVAFATAPTGQVKKFRSKLGLVCAGDGRKACKETGIRSLISATEVEYKAVIKAYGG